MKISVIGTGYVGLITGSCLANLGNDVICVDIDDERIANLRRGVIPFYEPGLREIVEQNVSQKRLMFTTDSQLAIENSDIVFIAVGTPSDKEGKADLSYVFQAADSIAKFANGPKVIVMKSTVPVGTCRKLMSNLKQNSKGEHNLSVVSNPEFLREGDAVQDFMVPDRIIVGSDGENGLEPIINLYKTLERTGRPIISTNLESSELIKYASNTMLAARISFMNELSHLCDAVGADIKVIAKGMGFDHRIGPRFLQAGVGYGGSCFPKDVRALAQTLKEHNCSSKFTDAIKDVNDMQVNSIVPKLLKLLPNVKGKKIAIWGISFKPKTDDIREAPAIAIINTLQQMGASISAFDPVAEPNARKVLRKVTYSDTPLGALEGANALILVTEWDLFRELDKVKMKELMSEPNILDGRNMYDPKDLQSLGFNYMGIGR